MFYSTLVHGLLKGNAELQVSSWATCCPACLSLLAHLSRFGEVPSPASCNSHAQAEGEAYRPTVIA